MAMSILTAGDNESHAKGVHTSMRPEYEVIYAGFSLPETLDEVPQILAGRAPPSASLHTQIASNSFDRRPLAIAVGGGYDDRAFDALRKACIEACGSEEALVVAFFRTDRQLTERLFAEGNGPGRKSAEYPKAITKRLKDKLAEVGVAQGLHKEDVGKTFWYYWLYPGARIAS